MIALLSTVLLSGLGWAIYITEKEKNLRKAGFSGRHAQAELRRGPFVLVLLMTFIGLMFLGAITDGTPATARMSLVIAMTAPLWLRLRNASLPGWLSVVLLVLSPFLYGSSLAMIAWTALCFVPPRTQQSEPLAQPPNNPLTTQSGQRSLSPITANHIPTNIETTHIMKLDDFSVSIPEGIGTKDGYVQMNHGCIYTLALRNDSEHPCDAEVKIDGGEVGIWRINPGSSASIERPVHDSGRFTFYVLGTPEAKAAQIHEGSTTGLISVIFRPGAVMQNMTLRSAPAPGGTGLSGKSEQRFSSVDSLDYFEGREVAIHLRLISSSNEPRPLHRRSTPIPPAIG